MTGKADIKNRLRSLLDPVVALASYLGITPMGVTIFGIFLSIIGAIYLARGRLLSSAIILILSGLCDTIDGSLARSQGKVSVFGAFIDSTGDRVSELAYFIGLVFYFIAQTPINGVLVFFALAALAGSYLTSYARARAEGLGLECSVGILERPERIVLLIAGLIFGRVVLTAVIVVLAVMSIFTFIQRVQHVRKLTSRDSAGTETD